MQRCVFLPRFSLWSLDVPCLCSALFVTEQANQVQLEWLGQLARCSTHGGFLEGIKRSLCFVFQLTHVGAQTVSSCSHRCKCHDINRCACRCGSVESNASTRCICFDTFLQEFPSLRRIKIESAGAGPTLRILCSRLQVFFFV